MGLPLGQVKEAASVSASTEKGASPSKVKSGAERLVAEDAKV